MASTGTNTANKGEWSEMYVFFRLLSDKKLYAADKNMKKRRDAYFKVIRVIRSEVTGQIYSYYTDNDKDDKVKITFSNDVNDKGILKKEVETIRFKECGDLLWKDIVGHSKTFTDPVIVKFLNDIYVSKFKSPQNKVNEYYGGANDVTFEGENYKSGLTQILSFSCKSHAGKNPTLFNSSGLTNFEFELIGDMDDQKMNHFNSLVDVKKNPPSVAINARMKYLRQCHIELKYVGVPDLPSKRNRSNYAIPNLVCSGGIEMPNIIGECLRYTYYECDHTQVAMNDVIKHLADANPADYNFQNSNYLSIYRSKIAVLLSDMFSGLRFSKEWDGNGDVSGGYIVVKSDGEVIAYHTSIRNEFKEYLVDATEFDKPSCKRQGYMTIYKKNDGKYYVKLALQIRFINDP